MKAVKSTQPAHLKRGQAPDAQQLFLLVTLALFSFLSRSVYAQEMAPLPAIDFSYAGYGGGGIPIPAPAAVISVKPGGGDDTPLLQAAIDHVSRLPVQENGIRGAIQLSPGRFKVDQQLLLTTGGIVLRGSGKQETTIVAAGKGRRTLIEAGNPSAPDKSSPVEVAGELVEAGSMVIPLEELGDLKTGDRIVITRPGTQEWIHFLGMDTLSGTFPDLRFRWTEGSRDLVWDRIITSVDKTNNSITLDAPITTALEKRFGGGTVAKVTGNAPLQYIGIENLILESAYDKSREKDEEHAWYGIALDGVENAWVRDVKARYFVSSAVRTGPRGRKVTILNCHNEQPRSEPGGYRRFSFLTEGQQVLTESCTADSGMNDFAIGFLAAGPNVFLNCTATNALGASGSYESWASGVLYEEVKIEGNDLRLTYDVDRAQGGGWTAANSIVWNCKADEIVVKGPAGAPVVVMNTPEALYRNQLDSRHGNSTEVTNTPEASSPVAENVKEFTAENIPAPSPDPEKEVVPLKIINGRFVTGETVAWGGSVNDAWWLGHTSPANALDAGLSITRYVPGRRGPGLTEDLQNLMNRIVVQGTPFYQSGPAIWYDRRRDDHSIKERPDGNVWAAFYELPWARSGQGKAWDGLSKYDLTTYNPWYFDRTKAFAALADQNGIILYHHLYNNHNLLETASHWIDSPWRPANNINTTGLPEPPPLEPRDRIHIANEFYDAENPALRELHRSYILHALDQLGHFENIIFGLSFQYSGPLAFQRFFQETVAEWEKKNKRKVRLVIDTGKNVTDSILADPEFAKQIAVIDMRYWHYLPDSSLWAPLAGQNRAFRELHPREFGDPTTPEQVYRQVREYHDQYPEKAIVSWHSGVDPVPALMAGGAQVLMRNPTAGHGQGKSVDSHPIDSFVKKYLSERLMHMQPKDGMLENPAKNWMLADDEHETVLLYSLEGSEIKLSEKLKNRQYTLTRVDPKTGLAEKEELPRKIKKGTTIRKPSEGSWLYLLEVDR